MKKEYDVNYKQHLKKAVYMKEIIILTDKSVYKWLDFEMIWVIWNFVVIWDEFDDKIWGKMENCHRIKRN
mgnify:CR=1 FL=1